jgi:uncharacterized phosphatase
MLELVLARHGQAFGNVDRSTGMDTDLTPLGCEQATRLGTWLAGQGYTFTAIYSSPLRRARQTAEIVNSHFCVEIVLDPSLRETEIPYLDRLPRRDGPLGREPTPPFNPEYEQMRERVFPAIARILAENTEGQVLIVAHAGTLSTILRSILGTHALILHTDLAAVHALRWHDGVWTLQYLNRQEHL